VHYRLNSAVQSEKSARLWERAEIREIFELQEWRCDPFGRIFSTVMVSGNGMLPSADRIDNDKDHDVRGNIRFVYAAANNARKALTIQQNKAQQAQIRAVTPPIPPLGAARVFECKKCGMGDVPCAYLPSTCNACYLVTSKENRSLARGLLV
jgi:hypothetical protein